MINVNGLKRNAKNYVKKYSEPQIKVREATSNDPWGPSSTLMAELADMTYNMVAFSEVMHMLWIRLNDHGRNWRHVYKALVVLEYLVKTGSAKVTQQCLDNICAIQTLKDFQYMEDGKDLGLSVREKSKKLVALLKDPEKLKAEKARAIKAKSRLSECISSGGETMEDSHSISNEMSSRHNDLRFDETNLDEHQISTSSLSSFNQGKSSPIDYDIYRAKPQNAREEEDQLKIALALSLHDAAVNEEMRKNDEVRLKLALDVSKRSALGDKNLSIIDVQSNQASSTSDEYRQQPKPKPQQNDDNALIKITSSNDIDSNNTKPKSGSNIDDLIGLNIPSYVTHSDGWPLTPYSQSEQSSYRTTDPLKLLNNNVPFAGSGSTCINNVSSSDMNHNRSKLASPVNSISMLDGNSSQNCNFKPRTLSNNPFEN